MIELSCNCDGCRKRLSDGDAVYCERCVIELRQEIEQLEKQIEKLQEATDE
jgi:hypothetical protein